MKVFQIPVMILFFLALTGCSSNSAYKFSETVVQKEKSLEQHIIKAEDDVANHFQNKNYDSIAYVGDQMENRVEKVIGDIKSMSVANMKEGENFKNATLRYFDYIKQLYTYYKEIGLAETNELQQEKLNEMLKMVDRKEKVLKEMQTAQQKFASANGFKVE